MLLRMSICPNLAYFGPNPTNGMGLVGFLKTDTGIGLKKGGIGSSRHCAPYNIIQSQRVRASLVVAKPNPLPCSPTMEFIYTNFIQTLIIIQSYKREVRILLKGTPFREMA